MFSVVLDSMMIVVGIMGVVVAVIAGASFGWQLALTFTAITLLLKDLQEVNRS